MMKPVLLILLLTFGAVHAAEPVLVGRVTKVTDGDTLRVELASGPITVRLDGIDAPESRMSHGAESKQALSAMTLGKEAQLEVITQDRYERLVAIVYVDGVKMNDELVRQGHAWAYRKYLRKATRGLCDLEREARTARRGLWSATSPVYPPMWRKNKASPAADSALLAACPK